MSRIGRKPVEIPAGVQLSVQGAAVQTLQVKGPLGTLTWELPREVRIEIGKGVATVTRTGDGARERARHGLSRALLANMVVGVHKGYERRLEIVGVGYRAQMKGKTVSLQVGFSHSVEVPSLPGVEVTSPEPTKLIVKGIDKQAVGQMAATLRGVRPPEPYKGKGIRYEGEAVRRKAGKAFVSGGA